MVILALGALTFFYVSSAIDSVLRSDTESVERVTDASGSEAPEVASEQSASEEKATQEKGADEESSASEEGSDEEEAAPTPPADPTMYLTIPKLGIQGALVLGSEAGLEVGTQLVTGYPWEPGSNTYVAGHRLGFPGTGSDHIFYNLPNLGPGDEVTLGDSEGRTYRYEVSEILQVDPSDISVTGPVGRDVVSLQTCIENYGDFWTEGPDWNVRYIVRADRVA